MLMRLRVGRAEFEGTPDELAAVARMLALHDSTPQGLPSSPLAAEPTILKVRLPANGRVSAKLVEEIPEETFDKLIRADVGIGPFHAGNILFGRPIRSVGEDADAWWALYSRIGKARRRFNSEDMQRRRNAAILAGLSAGQATICAHDSAEEPENVA